MAAAAARVSPTERSTTIYRRMVAALRDQTGVPLQGQPLVVIPPTSRGVIHRGVGVPENRFEVGAVIRVETDSDAQGDRESMLADEMGFSY